MHGSAARFNSTDSHGFMCDSILIRLVFVIKKLFRFARYFCRGHCPVGSKCPELGHVNCYFIIHESERRGAAVHNCHASRTRDGVQISASESDYQERMGAWSLYPQI